jgi:hypothetical protein
MEKEKDLKLLWPYIVLINLIGVASFFIYYMLLMYIIFIYTPTLFHYFYQYELTYLILTVMTVMTLHEVFHTIPYRLFGAEIKFSMTLLYAYVMDASGKVYSTGQMVFILLFPLFILSMLLVLLIVLFPSLVFYLCAGILLNIAGAASDILAYRAKGGSSDYDPAGTLKNPSILYSAFFTFDIERDVNGEIASVTFFGGGNGHGAGMSQYGASSLGMNGWTYDQILYSYYSGMQIIDVYNMQ